jgi:hypothetical protein
MSQLATFSARAVRRLPTPEWFATLKPGAILRYPGGTYRRVLSVHRREDGTLFAITLDRIRPGYSPGIGRTSGPVPYFGSTVSFGRAERESWSAMP